jgi:hypothetical protein
MLFADWFSSFLGQACLVWVGIVWLIWWLLSSLFKSQAVQDAARIGFWAWFLSDDD